ncbi:MAG: hypothetical protein AAF478_08005 [Pseudomonadota bacterium]
MFFIQSMNLQSLYRLPLALDEILLRYKNATAIICVFLFAIIGFVTIQEHPMWLDEVQAWLIAYTSQSFSEVYEKLGQEGHPYLWHLILYGLTRVSEDPEDMQILHWAIGVGAMIFFWWRCPFAIHQKVLFTFGFFPIYEYLIKSRNYLPSMFLLFVVCALLPNRHRNYIPLAVALGFLATVHAFSIFISCTIALILGVEYIRAVWLEKSDLISASKFNVSISIVIFLGLLGSALFPIYISATTALTTPLETEETVYNFEVVLKIAGEFLHGIVFISPHSGRLIDQVAGSVALLGIVAATAYYARNSRVAIQYCLIATSVLTIFAIATNLPIRIRHAGFLFLILISTIWISQTAGSSASRLKHLADNYSRKFSVVFSLILIVHMVAGCLFIKQTHNWRFSAGKDTVKFLRDHKLQDRILIGYMVLGMPAISAYLSKPIYYPELGRMGTYAPWVEIEEITATEVLWETKKIVCGQHPLFSKQALETSGPPILIFVYTNPLPKSDRYTLRYSTKKSMREDYLVYETVPEKWDC